jgi:hypothetical protein
MTLVRAIQMHLNETYSKAHEAKYLSTTFLYRMAQNPATAFL